MSCHMRMILCVMHLNASSHGLASHERRRSQDLFPVRLPVGAFPSACAFPACPFRHAEPQPCPRAAQNVNLTPNWKVRPITS